MPAKRPKKHHPAKPKPSKPPASGSTQPTGSTPAAGGPIFAQPTPSPDPTGFVDTTSDEGDYNLVDSSLLEAIPDARGGAAEPIFTLAEALGSQGGTIVNNITQSGQMVFHAVGDTGSSKGPATQNEVSDKMVSDFTETDAADVPSFFFHLGDVVYNFGEGEYYYDQFFEPYRNYPAPIIAIPGNHDGVVYKTDPAPTLEAFLRNFGAESFAQSPDAGGLLRSTMIEPSVFFTFDAPFVRILGVYSNVLEDPGVISSEGNSSSPVDDRQLTFLTTALERCKTENYAGAVIIAVHHPPYTYDTVHSGSPRMLQDLDQVATTSGFWPHAVISGHAHNYQRFTRQMSNNTQIPYIIAGSGGHAVNKLQSGTSGGGIRTPVTLSPGVTLENYDDTDYGYLRITVNSETLRFEFHPASDGTGAKTPDDIVTVNLQTRMIS